MFQVVVYIYVYVSRWHLHRSRPATCAGLANQGRLLLFGSDAVGEGQESANSVCGFFGPVSSLPPGFLCQVAAGLAAGLTPENLRQVIKVQSHKPIRRKLNIDGLLHKRGKERKVVRSITSLLKKQHASITHRLNPSSSCPPSQPSSPPRSQSPPPSSPCPPTPSSNPQPCP